MYMLSIDFIDLIRNLVRVEITLMPSMHNCRVVR
jgi:hypothetical protein